MTNKLFFAVAIAVFALGVFSIRGNALSLKAKPKAQQITLKMTLKKTKVHQHELSMTLK